MPNETPQSSGGEVRLYTPDSGLRSPGALLAGLRSDMFGPTSRALAWRLFVRNLSAEYRQTILGYAWVLIQPVAMSLVWIFLTSQQIVSISDTGIPYPLYAFSGNLLWTAFLLATQAPIRIVQSEMTLLSKLNFSREALLLTALGEALFSGLLQLVILIPVVLFYTGHLEATALLAPVGIFLLVLLGFTLGAFVTPLGLLFRDVGRAIPLVGRFWFFITPVVYPIPDEYPAVLLKYINPVSPLLNVARDLVTGEPVTLSTSLLVSCVLMVVVLGLALIVYRLSMPHIVQRMNA